MCFTCVYIWGRLISVPVHASFVTELITDPGEQIAPDPFGRGIIATVSSLVHYY